MKHNLFNWLEVKANEQIEVPKGRLRVRLSHPAPVYVSAQGVETLAGYGTEIVADLSEAVTVWADAPKGARIFVERPPVTSYQPDGEVFTNIDRMPDESGSMAEVLRARRLLEMERRKMVNEIRAEHGKMLAQINAAKPKPAPEPEPEPEPEPAPEPGAKQ